MSHSKPLNYFCLVFCHSSDTDFREREKKNPGAAGEVGVVVVVLGGECMKASWKNMELEKRGAGSRTRAQRPVRRVVGRNKANGVVPCPGC